MEFTAEQIAQLLGGRVEGDKKAIVRDMAKIEEAKQGTITFLANPKYEEFIYTTGATIALVNDTFKPVKGLPDSLTLIRVEDAYQCLTKLLGYYDQLSQDKKGVEEPSFVDESARLGADCYVGAFAYIGKNVSIGKNVKIYPHVYIGDGAVIGDESTLFSGVKVYHKCVVGKACTIHSGAIIGSDGFGFAPSSANNYQKVPQIGNVVLEDYVEVGSNTTIDRATMGSTVIRKGVKLDNLIQIAHNVEIGENTVIAAQTGVAGSTRLGKNMMIGGQVGIVGHIRLADGVKIAAQSGVGQNIIHENAIVQGSPAFNIGDYKRSYVLFRSLPKLREQILDLQKKLEKNES
ncbi:UDP-3-O-(3-hydroxymyristoyl)glucosamine N-acyltransferase [Parvicella tangerina]|uniref:UDP-3-O-acylglucosamine N-acyltransferase n=1 Tax=Parvicella tangerina TaxID=2829795 RepID=A0A916JRE4_9FLAO|nr:UDP-3-O-(3-hydroxymyristoyl)glucosamine N-acyltransferase [Parvicella tangerina]CAG5087515.1 UDP-3-O-acylglucosamine N-acyltransferase [Parvicella tangerina]